MDSLIERTQAYRQQAEDYRNDCIEGIHPGNLMFTSSDVRSLIANYKDFDFPPTPHNTHRVPLTAGVPPLPTDGDTLAGVSEGGAEASGWGQGGQGAADRGPQKVDRSHGS